MGRGSSGGGNLGNSNGGVNPANIKNERDLVSERERSRAEVDGVLDVARDIADEYGVDVGQFILADVGGKDSLTMAYSDGENIGFNSKYFDEAAMQAAYDDCVASGFHPSRGNKTGIQAVASHEYGHVLTEKAAAKLGITGANSMDVAAKTIVDRATKAAGYKGSMKFASKISGYAKDSNAECVAEAIADVYCNGSRAKAESKAIVKVINDILK